MTSDTAPQEARFFIAFIPPVEIQNYANSVIRELSDRYSTRTSSSPPHITLQAPFLWQMNHLARLESSLSQFAQSQSTVSIKLSGFGTFAPRVLYINVLKTPELLTLQANLVTHLHTQLGLVDPQHRSFSPHLTVASRHLTPATFPLAWADLQPRRVEFEFVGDRLTLLLHNGQSWRIQSQFLTHSL